MNDAASSISEERAGKIQSTAERLGRTQSKDNKWMAEVEAQVAALKAANGGAGEEECRLAPDEAHKQRIQSTAERLGRTASKDEKWMAEIEAQVAVLQAKMALEASACEFRGTSSSSRKGSTSGSVDRAAGNGIHDEYLRKKEQNEQDMLALSQWARENRAPSNYTDYRGRCSSRGSSHGDVHGDAHSSSSVERAASSHYEGSDCSSDFGMSNDVRSPTSDLLTVHAHSFSRLLTRPLLFRRELVLQRACSTTTFSDRHRRSSAPTSCRLSKLLTSRTSSTQSSPWRKIPRLRGTGASDSTQTDASGSSRPILILQHCHGVGTGPRLRPL